VDKTSLWRTSGRDSWHLAPSSVGVPKTLILEINPWVKCEGICLSELKGRSPEQDSYNIRNPNLEESLGPGSSGRGPT
jgi:hypothetical protein